MRTDINPEPPCFEQTILSRPSLQVLHRDYRFSRTFLRVQTLLSARILFRFSVLAFLQTPAVTSYLFVLEQSLVALGNRFFFFLAFCAFFRHYFARKVSEAALFFGIILIVIYEFLYTHIYSRKIAFTFFANNNRIGLNCIREFNTT